MTDILLVEYPKTDTNPARKRPVFEDYPPPWKMGATHESMCGVIASNGESFEIRARMGGLYSDNSHGVSASDIAEMIIAKANGEQK